MSERGSQKRRKIDTQLWIEIGQSKKCKHVTGKVVRLPPRAYEKITTGAQDRKRTLLSITGRYISLSLLLLYF